MSFQAYLDNIKAKTGKTAEDFKKLAEKKGLLKAETKAMEVVNWLKKEYDLGHGHAMALYASFKGFKGKDNVDAKNTVAKKKAAALAKKNSASCKEKSSKKKVSGIENAFPVKLAQPALRALNGAGIITLKQLSGLTEKEFSALHGIGRNVLIALKEAMRKEGLSFKG